MAAHGRLDPRDHHCDFVIVCCTVACLPSRAGRAERLPGLPMTVLSCREQPSKVSVAAQLLHKRWNRISVGESPMRLVLRSNECRSPALPGCGLPCLEVWKPSGHVGRSLAHCSSHLLSSVACQFVVECFVIIAIQVGSANDEAFPRLCSYRRLHAARRELPVAGRLVPSSGTCRTEAGRSLKQWIG